MALAGLLALALALRLLCFVGVTSGDAPNYSELAVHPVPGGSFNLDHGSAGPRLGLILPTRLAYRIFGPGEVAAALYPFLCSLGCVGLAWWLGRAILGPLGGLLAGGLVAICPWQLPYASVLGPDIPMGFWLAAAATVLWHVPSRGGRGGLLSAMAGVSLGFAVVTWEGALALTPLGLVVVWGRGARGIRAWRVMAFLLGILAGLWLPAPHGELFGVLRQYLFGDYLARRPERVEDYRNYLWELGVSSPWHRWREGLGMLVPGDHRFQAFGGIATAGILAGLFALRCAGPLRWVAVWGLGYALFLLVAASPRSPTCPVLVAHARYLQPVLVPLSILATWALIRLRPTLLRLVIVAWGLYLLYAGWVCTLQARSSAVPYREVAGWLATHPSESQVYGDRASAGTLRFLMGYPGSPRIDYLLPYYEPVPLGESLSRRGPAPGALVLMAPGGKDALAEGISPEALGWTEVHRWKVVTERGPRAVLAGLLGRPEPGLPTAELVAWRAPP